MGLPMVARLVEAGHEVRAHARNPQTRRDVQALGAGAANDLAETGVGADVVVVCVFSDDQVWEVCLDSELLAAIPAGSALVVHTTVNPASMEEIAARARGVDVVDAPISGGPADVAARRLTLFVGGSAGAVTRVRPFLECYGDPVLHVGPLGAGQKVKLINNALFASHIGLLAEAVRLAERLGVPESALLAALPHGSADSRVLNLAAVQGSLSAFALLVGDFVSKDVAAVRDVARELGAGLGVLDDVINAIHASDPL